MCKIKEQFDILKSEYDEISKRIYEIMLHQERLLNYSLLLFGAIITYGVTSKITVLNIFYPLGVFIVYFYTMYYITQIHALGGYRKFIEEKLNILSDKLEYESQKNIFIWEKYSRNRLQLDINNGSQVIIYLLILCILIYSAFSAALNNRLYMMICYLYILLFIILFISFFRAANAYNKTYNFYKQHCG